MPTTEEYDKYVGELERDIETEKQRSHDLSKANYGQMNLFNQENEENLIRWQLDMREDLDRLYHLLKGDILKEDGEGNVLYGSPEDENLKPFNEFGVQLLMNIMSFYLNRNTILSNYDEQTINWKILDFGNEVSDLIHNRYDEMMITIKQGEKETDEHFDERVSGHVADKLKLYPMIVKELVDTIHSAYLRAYHGGERESLRTARTVTQTYADQQRQGSAAPIQQQGGGRKLLRPWTW